MIELLFCMILIFLYYLICICVYIIWNNIKNKRIKKSLDVINRQAYEIIVNESKNLNQKKNLNNRDIKKLKQKLKNKDYQKHIIKYLLFKENKEEIIEFMNEVKITNLILDKKEKDEFDKAYKIYIIGEFNIHKQYEYLMNNIGNDSVYIQINILKALSKLGNKIDFIDSLKKIMTSSSLIHEKVLIDILYTFYESDRSLNKDLENELKNEDDTLNKIIIYHFINTKYEDAKGIIYDLVADNSIDTEVKIACIKYFAEIKYFKVESILIELLGSEKWEIRAISASALKEYKNEKVIEELEKSITDEVWYVRQNSAKSLYHLVGEKDKLKSIIEGDDKYASDSLISTYSEQDIIMKEIVEEVEYDLK